MFFLKDNGTKVAFSQYGRQNVLLNGNITFLLDNHLKGISFKGHVLRVVLLLRRLHM